MRNEVCKIPEEGSTPANQSQGSNHDLPVSFSCLAPYIFGLHTLARL